MKNQKLQSFFKTLFFKQNHEYFPTVLFFWYGILVIIFNIIGILTDKLFYGEYTFNWHEKLFDNAINNTPLGLLFMPIIKYFNLATGGDLFHAYSFTLFGRIVLISIIFLSLFFINYIYIKLYNFSANKFISSNKKRPTN